MMATFFGRLGLDLVDVRLPVDLCRCTDTLPGLDGASLVLDDVEPRVELLLEE